MLLSVVVNTYNRRRYIADCLLSLSRQSIGELDVIVVDGPSNDGTYDFVKSAYPTVKLARCPDRNLSKSRNIGIEAADGDVVAFLDDDAVAHQDWAELILGAYTDRGVGGAGGFTLDNTGRAYQSTHLVSDRRGDSQRYRTAAAAAFMLASFDNLYPSMLGANSSFRRSSLIEVGGFDETYEYFLDETDVCLRIVETGKRIATVENAIVLHRYAESHIRDAKKISKTYLATVRSKIYFMYKYAGPNDRHLIDRAVDEYVENLRFSLKWHVHRALISSEDMARQWKEIDDGVIEGRYRGCVAPRTTSWLKHAQAGADTSNVIAFPKQKKREMPTGHRIAFISQGYPPGDTNGISRWTKEIAEALAELGHVVHVVSRAWNGPSTTEYLNGVWVHRIEHLAEATGVVAPCPLPSSVLRHAHNVKLEILRIKELFGLDIVSGPIWDVEAILCHGIEGVRLVTSLHTTYAVMRVFKTEWRFNVEYDQHHVQPMIEAERWLLEASDIVVSNSRSIEDEVLRFYPGAAIKQKAMVAHGYAIDTSANRFSVDGLPKILFVGRVERRKGLDVLLRAAGMVDVPFALQIAGEAKAGDALHLREIADLKAALTGTKVRLDDIGFVADDELERLYRGAYAVVVPSRYESFGLVVIEAMRVGTPVIATRVGGMSDIFIDGKEGMYFEMEDAAHLAERLREILNQPELRGSLSRGAKSRFARSYSARQMATEYADALRGIAS